MRALVAAVVGCLLVAVAIAFAARGPAPKGIDASPTEFSEARAFEDVRMIAARPHPIRSIEHDRVRDALLFRLRALGVTPEVHTADVCNKGACGRIENIVAVLGGREDPPALVLAAHYDSRPEGPGASDDAAGVATILEIVRALREGPPTKNAVMVLLTDGEEKGLLGARAFVDQDAAMSLARVVLNFEARGTAGEVAMFETSAGSAWLVRAWAKAVARPVSSSVIYSLYKALPNDTDLTVFKEKGLLGLNFAYADRVWEYHTANDDPDHLDPRALQHMGDQGLATARALASADLGRAPDGELVWFDLFTVAVVSYRAWFAWVLAALAALAAITVVVRVDARKELLVAASVALAGLVLALVIGVVVMLVVPRRATFATPLPAWSLLTALGVASPLVAWRLLARGASPRALTGGIALVYAALALLCTARVIGASYLFVLPALPLALAAIEPRALAIASVLAPILTAILWFPLARILLVMVGAQLPPGTTLVVAFFALSLVPAVAQTFGKSGGGKGPATQPLASASR